MKIGWIGCGVMGKSMAGHLLAAGYDIQLFTRTRSKADTLLAAGATWCASPAEAAHGCEFVFAMVGYPAEVREVVLGRDGVLTSMGEGSVFIDCSTSSPALAVEIAEAARQKGADSLDAPVSGGDVGARNATLSIMVGGLSGAFVRAQPLLEKLGKTVVLQGSPGSGQHTKMVNQILIAAGMVALCEGIVYAQSAGLIPERVLQSVSGGAAGSWSLTNYAPRILKGDFAPGFYVEHFLKDMQIALESADEMKLDLPGLKLARTLYTRLAEMGFGKNGTQSLIKVLEELAREKAGR